ncbi:hypothetical protein [Alteromonas sp. PRIM-21]|uniref:hypothetical protein n=1 Tax=Alteromonas sp. PRIM-21 TaxID=1454978 RepID=UPI0022B95AC8|nr:hypothetical protein [Alteromonas sp. PRIM-21]MCZ8531168.1 hypothetical protein [Alteromonas sp. PRIM-21]
MKRTKHFSELVDLAEQVINGEASDSALVRLNALLHDNVDAQRFYLDYMQLHTSLKAESKPNVEVVRRRAVVDEVVVRPLHSTNEQRYCETTEKNKFDLQQRGSNLTTNSSYYLLAGALFLLCILGGAGSSKVSQQVN